MTSSAVPDGESFRYYHTCLTPHSWLANGITLVTGVKGAGCHLF
jgi:hypothetical protein